MRTLLTAVSLAALGCGVAFGEAEQSIDCGVLKKESNGNWSSAAPTTITLDGKSVRLFSVSIAPHKMKLGAHDVYEAINRKCGGE